MTGLHVAGAWGFKLDHLFPTAKLLPGHGSWAMGCLFAHTFLFDSRYVCAPGASRAVRWMGGGDGRCEWELSETRGALGDGWQPLKPFAIRDFQACSAQIQGIGNRGPWSPKVSRRLIL